MLENCETVLRCFTWFMTGKSATFASQLYHELLKRSTLRDIVYLISLSTSV